MAQYAVRFGDWKRVKAVYVDSTLVKYAQEADSEEGYVIALKPHPVTGIPFIADGERFVKKCVYKGTVTFDLVEDK